MVTDKSIFTDFGIFYIFNVQLQKIYLGCFFIMHLINSDFFNFQTKTLRIQANIRKLSSYSLPSPEQKKKNPRNLTYGIFLITFMTGNVLHNAQISLTESS